MKKLKAISILKDHLKKLDTLDIYDRDGMEGRNDEYSPFLKVLREDVKEIFRMVNQDKVKEYFAPNYGYIYGSSFREIQYNYNIVRHDLIVLINSSIKEINKWKSTPGEIIIENINKIFLDIKLLNNIKYSRIGTNSELKKFIEKCKRFLKKNYKEDKEKLEEFDKISFKDSVFKGMNDLQITRDTIAYKVGLVEVKTLFEIIVEEIEDGSFLFPIELIKEHENMITSDIEKKKVKSKVFIVHGHDDGLVNEISIHLMKLELDPVVLHEQANKGMTIIEKLEEHTNVVYGIILYTPCDEGKAKGELNYKNRARQNVVFEHGFLSAKLGRKKVSVIVKGDVETPGDMNGLVYIQENGWKEALNKELKSQVEIDINKLY